MSRLLYPFYSLDNAFTPNITRFSWTMYAIYSISMKNKELIAELKRMPEDLSKSLTGKRREIFKAVQNGEVEA